jgi:RNA polymerase sigma-70 factor
MQSPANFPKIIAESYCTAQAHYGDIDITLDSFGSYVRGIACTLASDPTNESALEEYTTRLYLRDLYLACGCVHDSEKAWKAFDARYRRFIFDLVRLSFRRGTDCEEVADSVLVSMYFHDRSGRKRIASYNGRSSLATWLRVIVINRAINDRHEMTVTTDEDVADVQDRAAVANLEWALLADRYAKILRTSLVRALHKITAEERLLLLWRYEQNLQLGEIAQLMGIHQSNVTRQLLRLQARIRESVVEILSSQYRLSTLAIHECLADAVANPQSSVSLLNLIKDVPKPPTNSLKGLGFEPDAGNMQRLAR